MSESNCSSSVLRTRNSRDNLSSNSSCCRKSFLRIYLYPINNCSILKHILKIDQTTIAQCRLSHIIHIVFMNNSQVMCFAYVLWKQKSSCNIGTCNAGNIVSLDRYNFCIFIRILIVPILTLP